jgi:hypothetical protein
MEDLLVEVRVDLDVGAQERGEDVAVGAEVRGGAGLDPLRLEPLGTGPDIGDLLGGQVRLNVGMLEKDPDR